MAVLYISCDLAFKQQIYLGSNWMQRQLKYTNIAKNILKIHLSSLLSAIMFQLSFQLKYAVRY
jgi:hypothetical protein